MTFRSRVTLKYTKKFGVQDLELLLNTSPDRTSLPSVWTGQLDATTKTHATYAKARTRLKNSDRKVL